MAERTTLKEHMDDLSSKQCKNECRRNADEEGDPERSSDRGHEIPPLLPGDMLH